MEIITTIKDLPERIKQLEIPHEKNQKKFHFPFLEGKVWDDAEGPTDISSNIDHYIYDSNNIKMNKFQ
ncbi:MAG: hypothetical protein ACOC23_06990 [Thermodesulfobacteriota bacterium]